MNLYERTRSVFNSSRRLYAVVAVALILMAACRQQPADGTPNAREIIVAAASDLGPAFEELGKAFEQEYKVKVTFSFGSTGTLAKQIQNDAPFDLFAAANISFVDDLEKQGLIVPETKALYARGRITIWTRAESTLSIKELKDLAQPGVQKVAIANPEHAPYGTAAKEALLTVGMWDVVQPKLVFGENVRLTLQYAETGNADVALSALSLSVQSKGRWVLVPDNLHKPLDQALAVIKNSQRQQEARQFAAFINSAQGRPIMRKYGFILPGEEPIP